MRTSGVVVGRVLGVDRHPNAERIRLARVDLGRGDEVQIVFGGPPVVEEGSLVPVAPPGARLPSVRKMRRRRYRGEISHGMLCSLSELGWLEGGPDEVVVLRDVAPGASLDDVEWRSIVASPQIGPGTGTSSGAGSVVSTQAVTTVATTRPAGPPRRRQPDSCRV